MSATHRIHRIAALPLLLILLLGSGFAAPPTADALTRTQRVGRALDIVRAQIGDPYRYGAAGPNAFDCSGLVYYSFRKAGFTNVPRTSRQQASAFRPVSRRNMRPGDFVFFHNDGRVYHMGVYVGWRNHRRVIIHASRSGTPVKRDPIWTNSWFARTLR